MNAASPRIILIEDDKHIRRFVCTALSSDGCQVYESASAAQGLLDAATRKPDLIILDLGLPDRDGVEVIRKLRNWSDMPILVLSARAAEGDKIAALDSGADDYLTKPFGGGELLARARALLRRRFRGAENLEPVLSFGDVTVDQSRRTVTRTGEAVHLTPIEYRLLGVMIANAGKVLTHRQLLREVWGPAYVDSSHYLRVVVGHLRQKLESDPAQPRHLLTETGIGYRFRL